MVIFLVTFAVTLVVFLVSMLALGLGLLMGRKGLTGSCGGIATLPGFESGCAACEKTCHRNEHNNKNKHND